MFNIVPCKLCVLYSIMPWNVVRSAYGDTCYECCLCNAHSKCCMAYVLKDYIPGEYEQKYTESTKRGTWGLSLLKRNKPEAMIWELGVVCNTDNIADFDMAYTSTNKCSLLFCISLSHISVEQWTSHYTYTKKRNNIIILLINTGFQFIY